MAYKVERTEAEWRQLLDAKTYKMMREFGTENPWSGDYVENTDAGEYLCKACDQTLFDSGAKFTAECGWPAFSEPVREEVLEQHEDRSQGMFRMEVRCTGCGSHLGFLFRDGPDNYGGHTGNRYCINSIALRLVPADETSSAGDLVDAFPA
jgi:peptide-methionine (R)-S-oxide reductase